MNDWKPTHRTKAGVEAVIEKEKGLWRVRVLNDGTSMGALWFRTAEAEALFEPIPPPAMVSIPLDVARFLACCSGISETARRACEAAVASASESRSREGASQ